MNCLLDDEAEDENFKLITDQVLGSEWELTRLLKIYPFHSEKYKIFQPLLLDKIQSFGDFILKSIGPRAGLLVGRGSS